MDLGGDSPDEMDEGDGHHSKFFPEVDEKLSEDYKNNRGSISGKSAIACLFNEDIATEPKDGSDPTVYSQELSVGPFSFVDNRQDYDPDNPAPTYMKYKDVSLKLPTEKEDIFENFAFIEKGGLRCTDEEAIERQKGVLKDVLKEFAKKFIRGLGISHMSLPVRIFEPRSTIQRVADYFCFAPIFLKRGAKCTDKVERFKYLISYFIAGMQVCTGQLKPFNPILGETLQSTLPDGSKVY